MTEIERLLDANERYAAGHQSGLGPRPARALAVVTCMDVRIDPLRVLGLDLGEAHIIRNAGGRITDDVLRSLAVSVHLLGTRAVAVMHHTSCGLVGTSDGELQRRTGAPMAFLPIADHRLALREDLGKITAAGYLSQVASVAGFLLDVETGKICFAIRNDQPVSESSTAGSRSGASNHQGD